MPASWMTRARGHKPASVVLSVLVLAVAVGVATAAIGSVGSAHARGGTAARGGTVAPGGTFARASGAGRASASGAGPGLPQAAVSSGPKWLAGPAGKLLDAVTADVGRITADQRAGSAAAARRDGTRLAGDCAAALRGPMPPVDASLYRVALRDFRQAGADAAAGNIRAASALLTPASLNVVTMTTTLNSESQIHSAA